MRMLNLHKVSYLNLILVYSLTHHGNGGSKGLHISSRIKYLIKIVRFILFHRNFRKWSGNFNFIFNRRWWRWREITIILELVVIVGVIVLIICIYTLCCMEISTLILICLDICTLIIGLLWLSPNCKLSTCSIHGCWRAWNGVILSFGLYFRHSDMKLRKSWSSHPFRSSTRVLPVTHYQIQFT